MGIIHSRSSLGFPSNEVIGNYQCEETEESITVSEIKTVAGTQFEWRNQSGKCWHLFPSKSDATCFDIGYDCPFYSNGYHYCKIIRDSTTKQVIGLLGPNNRVFQKLNNNTPRASPISEVVEACIYNGEPVEGILIDNTDKLNKDQLKDNWSSYEYGSLSCGPGSYYLNDPTISELHENIKTIREALEFIKLDYKMNPENPIIMWQLTNPWSDGIHKDPNNQYLCFHREKFLSQNLDEDSGKTLDQGFAKSVSEYQHGKKWGSPLYYKTCIEKTKDQ
mmetsp:Transcript_48099/g.61649  ORF Transcript_48099/g.61649 Transcript_48099/m.61649 type:complete len:277 (+) Transcript_48099:90-920(+)